MIFGTGLTPESRATGKEFFVVPEESHFRYVAPSRISGQVSETPFWGSVSRHGVRLGSRHTGVLALRLLRRVLVELSRQLLLSLCLVPLTAASPSAH